MTPEEKIAALEIEVADYRGQLETARELIASAQAAAQVMEDHIRSARGVIDKKQGEIERAERNHAIQAEMIASLERELAAARAGEPAADTAQAHELHLWQARVLRREEEIAIARRTIARLARQGGTRPAPRE